MKANNQIRLSYDQREKILDLLQEVESMKSFFYICNKPEERFRESMKGLHYQDVLEIILGAKATEKLVDEAYQRFLKEGL